MREVYAGAAFCFTGPATSGLSSFCFDFSGAMGI